MGEEIRSGELVENEVTRAGGPKATCWGGMVCDEKLHNLNCGVVFDRGDVMATDCCAQQPDKVSHQVIATTVWSGSWKSGGQDFGAFKLV